MSKIVRAMKSQMDEDEQKIDTEDEYDEIPGVRGKPRREQEGRIPRIAEHRSPDGAMRRHAVQARSVRVNDHPSFIHSFGICRPDIGARSGCPQPDHTTASRPQIPSERIYASTVVCNQRIRGPHARHSPAEAPLTSRPGQRAGHACRPPLSGRSVRASCFLQPLDRIFVRGAGGC